MLIFDQLKKEDPQLRVLTVTVLVGLGVLLAGLWWVQIVSARDYQESLETQSFRTVRIPAVRGSILDCNAAAADILGEPAEALRGQPLFTLCWDYLREDGTPMPPRRATACWRANTGLPLSTT